MSNIALITGSATRIGASIAKFLAKNNWTIIIHYNRSKSEAINLQKEINEASSNAYIKFADLNNLSDINLMMEQIINEIGTISLLINNASHFINDNISNISLNNFNKHMQINLLAPILLMQKFAMSDIRKSGNIINIIDYGVKNPPNKFLSYFLSKSSLWCATQMIAQMLAPNIRVNAIAPGPVIASINQSRENFDKLCQNSLVNHCQVDDICGAIKFILDTKSLTGQMISIDGGKSVMNKDYC